MDGTVYALAVDSSGKLYAGGNFTIAGGVSAPRIAAWNGFSWSNLSSGLTGTVEAILVDGSDLYVGGWFGTAGGAPAKRIAKWDGSQWSALGDGVGLGPSDLAGIKALAMDADTAPRRCGVAGSNRETPDPFRSRCRGRSGRGN